MLGMAVLVDEAIWEWRGAHWAHLVSDSSFDELHAFAQRIGKRRLGFQGDHYDIETLDRERAIDLGAEAVDARELLARLVGAGLRRRDQKPTWERVATAGIGEQLVVPSGVPPAIGPTIASLGGLDLGARSAMFVDATHAVALFDWHGDPFDGSDVSADQVWASQPRVDGERSLELFFAR